MELSKSIKKFMIATAALMMTVPLAINTSTQQVDADTVNTAKITDINITYGGPGNIATIIYKGPGKIQLIDINGNYTNQYVNLGSKWKTFGSGIQRLYSRPVLRIGNNNQWIPLGYANISYQPIPTLTAIINYIPGYSIAAWNTPAAGHKATGKYLKHGTAWNVVETSTSFNTPDGYMWYNLGGNQWISSKYTTIPKR